MQNSSISYSRYYRSDLEIANFLMPEVQTNIESPSESRNFLSDSGFSGGAGVFSMPPKSSIIYWIWLASS
jgi:hypothetical protein